MEKALLDKITSCLEKSWPQVPNPVVAFDADGTLWPHDVGKSFFKYQVKNHLLNKVSNPQTEFNRIREKESRKNALIWLAQAQAGTPLNQLNQWIKEFLTKNPFKMFPFQQKLIKWLMAHKIKVFVVSCSCELWL